MLRGEHKARVLLKSQQRSKTKATAILLQNVQKAGLEDLTIYLDVRGADPIDRKHLSDGGYCNDCFQNDPHGLADLYIRMVHIDQSQNCWIDNCMIIKAGTDPIMISGSHNTVRNCLIDRAYNKGGGGQGYFDIWGDHNLIVGNTGRRIRHLAIQQGAKHNVVLLNRLEVDVNFHNKDGGHNLVERNDIAIPTWHGWHSFSTGGEKFGHAPPGTHNVLFNNRANYQNQRLEFSGSKVVYTFRGYGDPVDSGVKPPKRRTFYPIKRARVAKPPTTRSKPSSNDYRTWATADGKFKVVAKLVEKNASSVRLKRKDDGKVITVPIERLGKSERDYLQQH